MWNRFRKVKASSIAYEAMKVYNNFYSDVNNLPFGAREIKPI